MGMRKVWTIAVAAAVCAALILTRQKPVQYRCAAVEVREIAVCVEAVGTVNFAQTRALNVPTAGTVARVFLQEGDAVQEGQAVAELTPLTENWEKLRNLAGEKAESAEFNEQMLKVCTLRAPADGVLYSLPIYPGAAVTPGMAAGAVVSQEKCVKALVPESAMEQLKVGQAASVTRAGKEYAVSISKIAPSDAQAGQIEITLTGDALRRLSAGMRADVRIVLEQCTAPSVPLEALRADGAVLCVTESGAVAVPVETGLCSERYVQLVEGPPVGTQVALGEA